MGASAPIKKKEKDGKVKKAKKQFKNKKTPISEEGGLNASVLNNEIILMRKSVKKSYPGLFKKLGYCINNPEKSVKEGKPEITDENEKATIKKQFEEELDLLKSKVISPDEVAKFALINKKKETQLDITDSMPVSERLLKKMATQKAITMHVKKFRKKFPQWETQVPFLLQRLGLQYQANKSSKGDKKTTVDSKRSDNDENSKANMLARIKNKTDTMQTTPDEEEDSTAEPSDDEDDSDAEKEKPKKNEKGSQKEVSGNDVKEKKSVENSEKEAKSVEKELAKAAVLSLIKKENLKAIKGGKKLISQKQERKVHKPVDLSNIIDPSAISVKKSKGESVVRRLNLNADDDFEAELEKERSQRAEKVAVEEESGNSSSEADEAADSSEDDNGDVGGFFITPGSKDVGFTGANESDDEQTTERRLKKRADRINEGKSKKPRGSRSNNVSAGERGAPPQDYKSPWRGAGPREKHGPWRGQEEQGIGQRRGASRGGRGGFSERGRGSTRGGPVSSRGGMEGGRGGSRNAEKRTSEKPAEDEQLHPSWIAKKKLRETLAAKPAGKKIVFDD